MLLGFRTVLSQGRAKHARLGWGRGVKLRLDFFYWNFHGVAQGRGEQVPKSIASVSCFRGFRCGGGSLALLACHPCHRQLEFLSYRRHRHCVYYTCRSEPLPYNEAAVRGYAIRGQTFHEHVPNPHLYLRVFFSRLYLRVQIPNPDFPGAVRDLLATVHWHRVRQDPNRVLQTAGQGRGDYQ